MFTRATSCPAARRKQPNRSLHPSRHKPMCSSNGHAMSTFSRPLQPPSALHAGAAQSLWQRSAAGQPPPAAAPPAQLYASADPLPPSASAASSHCTHETPVACQSTESLNDVLMAPSAENLSAPVALPPFAHAAIFILFYKRWRSYSQAALAELEGGWIAAAGVDAALHSTSSRYNQEYSESSSRSRLSLGTG